jgi:hypothetical protein
MDQDKRDEPDRIGRPDPENEPKPPRVADAGELGKVGERKIEEGGEKDAIWRNRPPTPDQDPTDPAAR